MLGDTHRRHRRAGGRRFSVWGPAHTIAFLAILCLIGMASVSPVAAQQADPAAAEATGEQTPIGETADAAEGQPAGVSLVSAWDFIRMILVLVAVIAFIYVVFILLRRGAKRSTVENELITLLGSRSLAGNRSLHLVRVGKSIYLVGSADGSVGLVSEISDKETVDEILLEAAKQRPGGRRSFSEILGGLMPQGGSGQLKLPDGLGFVRRQRERLRKLRSL